MNSTTRKSFGLVAVIAVILVSTMSVAAAPHTTVDIQIINVSDWHGQLDPLVVGVTQVGGAAALSTYFQNERAANPNTLTLTAGDAVGATPPLSSFFQDVPTILAMNLMGFQVDTFGNHNFDAGIARLQSQINLANFDYVSANLQNRDDNLTGVQDFQIYDVGGVKVGVVGLTNPEAPTLVFPGNFGTIVPTDPVKAAIQARGAAKDAGADIVVVITHMGVTGFDVSGAPFGPLIDFANAVNKDNNKNPKIDVIVGDHTDIQFSGIINGALVYENRSKGLTYARAVLTIDSESHKILNQSVTFVTPTTSAVTPDPAIVAMLVPYRAAVAPIFNTVVGKSTVIIPRADACGQSAGRSCESLIGDLVTDAMRSAYGTDFALTNSGGLRANLTCPVGLVDPNAGDFCPPSLYPIPDAGGNYAITRGQVLGVLPFGNVSATLTINGAELKDYLETAVSSLPVTGNGRFGQVSGLCFTFDVQGTAISFSISGTAVPGTGSRVVSAIRQAPDGTCTGAAISFSAGVNYTLTTNDFTASGGDGYQNFKSRITTQDSQDQDLADYLAAAPGGVVSPAIQSRIHCTDSNTLVPPACPVGSP